MEESSTWNAEEDDAMLKIVSAISVYELERVCTGWIRCHGSCRSCLVALIAGEGLLCHRIAPVG